MIHFMYVKKLKILVPLSIYNKDLNLNSLLVKHQNDIRSPGAEVIKHCPADKCSNANCWHFNIYSHDKMIVFGI